MREELTYVSNLIAQEEFEFEDVFSGAEQLGLGHNVYQLLPCLGGKARAENEHKYRPFWRGPVASPLIRVVSTSSD